MAALPTHEGTSCSSPHQLFRIANGMVIPKSSGSLEKYAIQGESQEGGFWEGPAQSRQDRSAAFLGGRNRKVREIVGLQTPYRAFETYGGILKKRRKITSRL